MKRLQLNRESKYKRVKRSSQRVAGKRAAAGFTLIELLIVIVVIAILAAISVIAYRGISNRASDAAVKSDLAQMYKIYTMSSIDEGPTFHSITDEHSDWSSHEEVGGRYLTPITSPGQDELKQLLGLTPDRPYYYNKGDDISVAYIMEYTDYYDPNTDTYRYKYTPVFYARSASGEVFRHDGRITQDLGSKSSEIADELRDNIDFYEHEINFVDACYSGGAPAEECGDMSKWPPISEWLAEKEGALLQVAEWRRILNELLDGPGYSLSVLLPSSGCDGAHVFLQSKSKWYSLQCNL